MSSDKILHVTELDFQDKVLGSDKPVLVDFWAVWCGPCKTIAPLLEEAADQYGDQLQIAKLIARQANLLLLDEPTNHVSLDVLEEFEKALLDFPGPVIAISHDRHFIRRFANEIWQLDDHHLRRYLGSWEEFRMAQGTLAID